jgi:DNA-binding NtrC family response regulator
MARRRGKKPVLETGHEGPGRVLVVHDDAGGLELLARILAVAGHDVGRAENFDEMSDLLVDAPPPDCIVLDVNSGGIGGNLKLLDAVRNHPKPEVSHTRVVLVAGNESSAMFSWQAGIDEFLPRPFHADDLITAVAEALARPDGERRMHRRRMLDASSGIGR